MRNKKNRKEFSVDAILGQLLTPFRREMIQRAQIVLAQQAEEKANQPEEGQPPPPPLPPAFTVEDFNEFAARLKMLLPDPTFFRDELENVRTALTTGKAAAPPKLARPETQLLWGAALLAMQANIKSFRATGPVDEYTDPNNPGYTSVSQLAVWDQLTELDEGFDELARHAVNAAEGLRRMDARLGWGDPGTLFRYDAKENQLSADLMMSLLAGFVQVRSVMINEIGRTQLTMNTLPPRQRAVGERMMQLKEKEEKENGLEEADYKALRLLAVEWELRQALTDAAEDNTANRYAARKSEILRLQQDYAYSLNHTLVTMSPFGEMAQYYNDLQQIGQLELRQAPPVPPDAYAAFTNVVSAVRLAFYKNNDLFENKPEGWQKMGVEPGWIRRADSPANDDSPEFPSPDLAHLLELCGGAQGLENLQPNGQDRWFGDEYYNNLTAQYAAQRHEVIEKIWDEYLEAPFRELMLKVEEKIDKEMEQARDQKPGEGQEQKKKQKGPKQKGQQQQGGKGQKGQKGQKGEKGKGQPGQGGEPGDDDEPGDVEEEPQEGDEPEEGDPQDEQDQDKEGQGKEGQEKDGQGKEGKKGDKKQKGKKGGEGEGEGKDKEESGASELSKAGLNKEGRKVDVKGKDGKSAGKMPDVDVPKEMKQGQENDPGQKNGKEAGKGQDQKGKQGKPGQQGQQKGQKPGDKGSQSEKLKKTLTELFEEAKKKKDQKAAERKAKGKGQEQSQGQGDGGGEDGPESDQPGQSSPDGQSGSGGHQAGKGGQGKTLEEIGKGDWKDYPAIVAQLMGPIMQVQRLLKKVQDHQLRTIQKQSRRLEQLPQGNDVGRLDLDAHESLTLKRKTGQEIEERDLDRFRRDDDHKKPVELDVVLLIDGSGSMDTGKNTANLSPLESALLTATILYEAARRLDANVYIMMWGSVNPVMLAKPGDDVRDIAQNIVGAREGLSSGTSLAPAIKTITKQIAAHKGKQAYTGYTHMVVLSDGDIDDQMLALKAIDSLMMTSPYVTMDFAIITGSQSKSAMEGLADKVASNNPVQKIGIVVDSNPVSLPAHVIGLLLDKIRQVKSFIAIPYEQKRRTFQRALRNLGPS